MPIHESTASRRERNKSDKQQRIFSAAEALFAEIGYNAVTTMQISERADVASGTLFRYASSKAELLLMVYNADYRETIARGKAAMGKEIGVVERIETLVGTIVTTARRNDENTAIYQRELLFGEAAERYRAEGLALVMNLISTIEQELLSVDAANHRPQKVAHVAARAIFAFFQMELSRAIMQSTSTEQLIADIKVQIELIVAGYLSPTATP